MTKVQIRLFDDFTNTKTVKIEVQEMSCYERLFYERVPRTKSAEVVNYLKNKYPNHDYCEFLI